MSIQRSSQISSQKVSVTAGGKEWTAMGQSRRTGWPGGGLSKSGQVSNGDGLGQGGTSRGGADKRGTY